MKAHKPLEDRWKNSGSHCTVTEGKNGLLHFDGTYYLNGVAFPFTCNEQASGDHLLRGQVSVFAQSRGQLMRIQNAVQDKKPVTLSKSIYPRLAGSDNSLLPKGKWKYPVMERVEYAAQSLFENNRSLICRDTELAATPNTITPQTALTLYCDAYLRIKHGNATDKSLEDYRRALARVYRCLPNMPMCQIKASHIQAALRDSAASKQAQKLARDFWCFCLDSRYCIGGDPFPSPERRRKSGEAKQAAADRLDVLDECMQEDIYTSSLASCSGADCGVALVLWGGHQPKFACSLLWGAVQLVGDNQILIPNQIEDNAGATHNYNRVLMPQGSSILLQRRQVLLEKYGKTRLKKMPVVSLASNPEKAMRPDDLGKTIAATFQRLALQRSVSAKQQKLTASGAIRICLNTYRNNLIYACCLHEDSGLYRFLSGMSLAGNVTADHYRSFTDEDGIELQCSVMRRMAPDQPIKLGKTVDTSHPDYDVYYYSAPKTRDLIALSLECDDLMPNDTVSVLSRYGGDIHAECESNGSISD